MPVPKGTRFRVKKGKDGSRVRLAIAPSGKVMEAKKLPKKAAGKGKKR